MKAWAGHPTVGWWLVSVHFALSASASIARRIASGSVGQASMMRAKAGSIGDSRAKEWAKGFGAVDVTCLPEHDFCENAKGFESPWGYWLRFARFLLPPARPRTGRHEPAQVPCTDQLRRRRLVARARPDQH